ncbi:SLOG family protein [Streptomyces sp. SAS_275]|uniref:SLOG family protein n=1 Tax=Streptomyces sp. SAS_275 TaxID=3412746 RepID=UPI00403C6FB2
MIAELSEPRVLICGSRRWPWPATVKSVLDRLAVRYGTRLVVIEGAASGADRAAHDWCDTHGLGVQRHRCFPVDWQAERASHPTNWRAAGPKRNTRILLEEHPRLIVAFHDHFDPGTGGTSDMCLRGLLKGVPVWLVPGRDPGIGCWLTLEGFPKPRADRIRRELHIAPVVPDHPKLFNPPPV